MRKKVEIEAYMGKISKKNRTITKAEKMADKAFSVFTYSVLITLCANIMGAKAVNIKRFENIDQELFVSNAFNIPATLPVSNGTVNINITKCFNKEQLSQIIKGISELDDVAEGIDFTLSFSDRDMNKSINIKSYADVADKDIIDETYGFVNVKSNAFSNVISYPIILRLNTSAIDDDQVDCSAIIKHELLHCLGFVDLVGYEYQDYLMHYAECGNNELSKPELRALNSVYSPKYTGYARLKKPVKIDYRKIQESYFNQMPTEENECLC